MAAVAQLLAALRAGEHQACVVGVRTEPARPALGAPFPDWLLPELRAALESQGIGALYSHQREAVDHIHAGRNVAIATSTASGKSLCYNLPILDRLLRDGPATRALYLFPTKALSRDQIAELERLLKTLGRTDLQVAVYDGDTPPAVRRNLREGGHLVVTNPHMLHAGILPNHTRWQGLFTGLRYVVVDEVHTLSGVYGSHVANVLRRLRRICAHYGSKPTFILSSATISNPGEHARRLVEDDVVVVDRDGSPRGERHFVFYNPPVVSEAAGLRTPAVEEVRRLAALFLPSPCQTIYFANSRRTVEILLKYLHDLAAEKNLDKNRVMGYRGGYLPDLRRQIEKGLREGRVSTVVATNALELGIDIGRLDVCVMLGYPGTVSSTFQRAGRVGRRQGESLVVMVARSFAVDQYVVHHQDYLFNAPRESVAIAPDNLIVLANHLKCAAFELPFTRGAGFGQAPRVDQMLDFLTDDLRLLVREGDRYHFAGATYPSDGVSLSTAEADNVVILDADTRHVLAEIDRASAITEVHKGAIYGHQGEQYLVEDLDFANRRAVVRRVHFDYYTEAETDTEVRVVQVDESRDAMLYQTHFGEVHVSTLATGYKKIRFYTRENIGAGDINLPPEEMETEACVFVLKPELQRKAGLGEGAGAGALRGVGELIQGLVPLFVRTDPGDVKVKAEVRNPHFELPALILYDRVPNGVGLSETLFRNHKDLLAAALEQVKRCICRHGCPGCIGPSPDAGIRGKDRARVILEGMLQ